MLFAVDSLVFNQMLDDEENVHFDVGGFVVAVVHQAVQQFRFAEVAGDGAQALLDLPLQELISVESLLHDLLNNQIGMAIQPPPQLINQLIQTHQRILRDTRPQTQHPSEYLLHSLRQARVYDHLLMVLDEASGCIHRLELRLPGTIAQTR
jgi:hypothetical protein